MELQPEKRVSEPLSLRHLVSKVEDIMTESSHMFTATQLSNMTGIQYV